MKHVTVEVRNQNLGHKWKCDFCINVNDLCVYFQIASICKHLQAFAPLHPQPLCSSLLVLLSAAVVLWSPSSARGNEAVKVIASHCGLP